MASENISIQLQTIGLELQILARAATVAILDQNESALEEIAARRQPLIESIQRLSQIDVLAVKACPVLAEAAKLESEFLQKVIHRRDEIAAEWETVQNKFALAQAYGPDAETSYLD